MWQPDHYIEDLLNRLQGGRESADERADRHQRANRLREALALKLGDFSEAAGYALDSRLIERAEQSGMIRERVDYATDRLLRAPAYVLKPKNITDRRRPAIIALHGHGSGSGQLLGLPLDDGDANTKPDEPDSMPQAAEQASEQASEQAAGKRETGEGGVIIEELAARGFIVLVPELAGFGVRRLAQDAHEQGNRAGNSCFPLAAALLMAGKTLAGLRVHETMRALDYMSERIDVDSGRIGILGFSGGAMVASLASALNPRFQATVLSGYGGTYRGTILSRRHCLDNYIPGILPTAELPELLGLIAPRPLYLESGLRDHLFPPAETALAASQLARIYLENGAEEQFVHKLFSGGHELGGTFVDWLEAVL